MYYNIVWCVIKAMRIYGRASMEFYAELLGPILPHLKEYAVFYIVGIPILLVIIVLTRRYSVPLIVFLFEFIVAACIMHALVHVNVLIFAWFKNSSSMQMVRDPEDDVYWTTPMLHFWEWDIYSPQWVIWVEAVFLMAILLLIYRFRPLKPQYKHKSRYYKPKPASKTGADDDDWGTPRQFLGLPDSGKLGRKK